MPTVDAILIAGPTASGKSAFAMDVAESVGGVIVNADSMQVYRELRILTARPARDDENRIPHELYGHVAGVTPYSVGRFLEDARQAIARIRQAGKTPIVVGGTGLYFKGLLEGLSPIPPIDPNVRTKWRGIGDTEGAPALHRALSARDPQMAATLMPGDTQRLVRALEVIESTGKSLLDWQKTQGTPTVSTARCAKWVISPPRDALYAACNDRFEQMLARGAIAEVEELLSLQLSSDLPIMRALGVAPLAQFIAGDVTLSDATSRAQTETRQYAKRQQTWLSKNMISWKWYQFETNE